MPQEQQVFTPTARLMQADEINRIADSFIQLGIKKIRLTGGEPLIRKDAGDIIQMLSGKPVELSITTNGLLAHRFLPQLSALQMGSVNISIDSLDPVKFAFITKRDVFSQVMDNITLLREAGIPLKLNVVAMKGINDDEIAHFVRLTQHHNIQVRFIEYMPFTGNGWSNKHVMSLESVLQHVSDAGLTFDRLEGHPSDTARKYKVAGFKGSFAIISTMTAPFCSGCNRIRLTADGKIKNCLFSKTEVDILQPLRRKQDIVPIIQAAITDKKKERGGQFEPDYKKIDPFTIENRSMVAIGG